MASTKAKPKVGFDNITTGHEFLEYIKNAPAEVKENFDRLQRFTGVFIEDTDRKLMSKERQILDRLK